MGSKAQLEGCEVEGEGVQSGATTTATMLFSLVSEKRILILEGVDPMAEVSPSHFKMSPSQRSYQWITKNTFYTLMREVEILNGTLLNHLRTSIR